MKRKILTLSACFLFVSSSFQLYAQCEKKKYCSDYFDDFDYRSQSSFAKLSPGDTSSISVVLYGGQKYRIFICSDEKLGKVNWKLVNPERKTKRTIQSIKKDTLVLYKVNEYGDYETDEMGNLLVKEKKINTDTLWNTERITVDKVVFDNKSASAKPYYEIQPKKSERFIIRLSIPSGDPYYEGCVNAYIGRLAAGSKSFSREGNVNTKIAH